MPSFSKANDAVDYKKEVACAWEDALRMIIRSGIDRVILNFVHVDGIAIEVETSVHCLKPESFDQGITVEVADRLAATAITDISASEVRITQSIVVYPNPHAVMINPFKDHVEQTVVIVADTDKSKACLPLIQEKLSEDEKLVPPSAKKAKLLHVNAATKATSPVHAPMKWAFPITISSTDPATATPQHPAVQLAQQPVVPSQTHSLPLHDSGHGDVPVSQAEAMEEARIYASSRSRTRGINRGTSCHQCKNARMPEDLAFCTNVFHKRTHAGSRTCRKKFCEACLQKFYNDSLAAAQMVSAWICPSCRGCCRCAACTRKREEDQAILRMGAPMLEPIDGRAQYESIYGPYADVGTAPVVFNASGGSTHLLAAPIGLLPSVGMAVDAKSYRP